MHFVIDSVRSMMGGGGVENFLTAEQDRAGVSFLLGEGGSNKTNLSNYDSFMHC